MVHPEREIQIVLGYSPFESRTFTSIMAERTSCSECKPRHGCMLAAKRSGPKPEDNKRWLDIGMGIKGYISRRNL